MSEGKTPSKTVLQPGHGSSGPAESSSICGNSRAPLSPHLIGSTPLQKNEYLADVSQCWPDVRPDAPVQQAADGPGSGAGQEAVAAAAAGRPPPSRSSPAASAAPVSPFQRPPLDPPSMTSPAPGGGGGSYVSSTQILSALTSRCSMAVRCGACIECVTSVTSSSPSPSPHASCVLHTNLSGGWNLNLILHFMGYTGICICKVLVLVPFIHPCIYPLSYAWSAASRPGAGPRRL